MAHTEQNGAITEDMIGWKMEYRGDLLVLTKQDTDERNTKRYMGEEFAFRESIFLRDKIKEGEDPWCASCERRLLMLKKDIPSEGGEDMSLSETTDSEEDMSLSETTDAGEDMSLSEREDPEEDMSLSETTDAEEDMSLSEREDAEEDMSLSETTDSEEDMSLSEREDTRRKFIGEECFISPLCNDFHSFICLGCCKDRSVEFERKPICLKCGTHQCTWLSADEKASMQILGMVAERRTVAGQRTISFKNGSSVCFNHSYMSMDAFKALLDWVDVEIEEELSVVVEDEHTDISFTGAQRGKLMELEDGSIRIHASRLSFSDENLCVLPVFNLRCVSSLELNAREEKSIRELVTRGLGSISTGEKKELALTDYAVGMFPILKLQETETLKFAASKMEHIKELLKYQDDSFDIGGYDNTWNYTPQKFPERTILWGYAVTIFPLLKVTDITELELDAPEKEHIEELLKRKPGSIRIGVLNPEDDADQELKLSGYAIKILPILILEEMSGLELSASKEDHVKELLEGGTNSIYFYEKLYIRLTGYAVGVLPKLQRDEIRGLELTASEKDHIKELLKCDPGSIVNVGEYSVDLSDYAIGIFTRLCLKDIQSLWFDSSSADCIAEFLEYEDCSVDVGEASVHLKNHAVNMLPKLKLDKVSIMWLSASNEDHIKEILKHEGAVVCGQRTIKFEDYAVNTLAKLKIQNIGKLELSAEKEEHIKEVLKWEDCSVNLEGVENVELTEYAVNILPKLKLGNTKSLELCGQEEGHIKEILKYEYNSIDIGEAEKVELGFSAGNIVLRLKLEGVEELRLGGWEGELSELFVPGDCSTDLGEKEKAKLEEYLVNMLPKSKLKKIDIGGGYRNRGDYVERILRWGFNNAGVSESTREREIRFEMGIVLAKEICSRLKRTGGWGLKVFDLDGNEFPWSPTYAGEGEESQSRLE
ncbi:MAG: uncharacterized protein A8A55_1100 [Amphiamblys sp. WSBS2006]|nr:MAG: uncharacterized protein A8A55_1100 [Amphiamblys sp. WSBS2006]